MKTLKLAVEKLNGFKGFEVIAILSKSIETEPLKFDKNEMILDSPVLILSKFNKTINLSFSLSKTSRNNACFVINEVNDNYFTKKHTSIIGIQDILQNVKFESFNVYESLIFKTIKTDFVICMNKRHSKEQLHFYYQN